MALSYRNRQLISDKFPEIGQAIDEAFGHISSIATQTNASLTGVQADPPPPPSQLVVKASQGIFEARIHDTHPVARGINYFLEYSKSPSFSAPTTIDLGQSRNYRAHLGSQTLYWRAHSSYPTSARSLHVYHGTQTTPVAVSGGGFIAGPDLLDSSGSGTSYGASSNDGAFGNQLVRSKIQQ